jgi:hypothetical protein
MALWTLLMTSFNRNFLRTYFFLLLHVTCPANLNLLKNSDWRAQIMESSSHTFLHSYDNWASEYISVCIRTVSDINTMKRNWL